MEIYQYTMPSGAPLTGYLRDESEAMPDYNVRPAVLILPGGGYHWCSPREADPVAVQFLQAGYQVFTLIYTTFEDGGDPVRWQPLIDAAGAILHLRQNAKELRLDPDKIVVCGFSAGGHLAASTAVLWDAAPVYEALGTSGTETRPNAVVLSYPVITTGPFAHRGSVENLAGDDVALVETMSLENQIKPGLPPFFIWHTVEDEAVPVQNSLMFATALKANDVPFEMHLFAHGGHGSSTSNHEVGCPNAHNAAWVSLCTDWLADTLDFTL